MSTLLKSPIQTQNTIRVSALHALAYCERLFYLEEVEELYTLEVRGQQVWLSNVGVRKFIQLYERRKDESWKHPILGYSLSYRRLFELEVRLLEKEWMGGRWVVCEVGCTVGGIYGSGKKLVSHLLRYPRTEALAEGLQAFAGLWGVFAAIDF